MGAPELTSTLPALRRIVRTVIVANPPMGLHVRPAAAFAKIARGLKCSVTLSHGPKRADGRSAFDLLGLLAEPGTELVLEIEGDDADIAVGPLCEILTSDGDHSESP